MGVFCPIGHLGCNTDQFSLYWVPPCEPACSRKLRLRTSDLSKVTHSGWAIQTLGKREPQKRRCLRLLVEPVLNAAQPESYPHCQAMDPIMGAER